MTSVRAISNQGKLLVRSNGVNLRNSSGVLLGVLDPGLADTLASQVPLGICLGANPGQSLRKS